MTKNIDELVLDAFRVEYREQLDQIRALLGALHPGEYVAGDARTQNAFRLAHSFKGGARVCDLREAEQLGHGLESVLEKVTNGAIDFNERVFATITLVLDLIEDWMAAFDRCEPTPPTRDALETIDQLLAESTSPTASNQENPIDRLGDVFRDEFNSHFASLDSALHRWKAAGRRPSDEELTETARIVHTLAGAAAVVVARGVESAAQQLERLLFGLREESHQVDEDTWAELTAQLEMLEAQMRVLEEGPNRQLGKVGERFEVSCAEATPACDETAVTKIATTRAEPSAAQSEGSSETVRIPLDGLNRLMRSSSAMVAANQQVGRLGRHISELERQVAELERDREEVRRFSFSALHKLAATPEYGRLSRYLEHVDRHVSCLARKSRRLSVEHQRVEWQLHARASQVQRDVHQARLVPAGSVFQGFRKMLRDLAKTEGKEIEFEAEGLDVRADRMVLQELKDSVMHVLRNCISHGIESPHHRVAAGKRKSGRILLRLEVAGDQLTIDIEDDGRGIDIRQLQQRAIERGLVNESTAAQQSVQDALSFVFEPGFSTVDTVTELAGRGMGLSIVREATARLRGQAKLTPLDAGGLRVSISVPIRVLTHRVLTVACGEQVIAIPAHGIERLLRIPKEKIESFEGRPTVMHNRRPIGLVRLCDVLGIQESVNGAETQQFLNVVLIKAGARLLAVSVTALLEQRDALILNLDDFASCRLFAGGVLLDDGRVAIVVEPSQLAHSTVSNTQNRAKSSAGVQPADAAKILIVDDSFTTRTLEKSILEAHGFDVSIAVDGVDALSKLRQHTYSLVISDIEMPRMDGFTLLETMKSDRRCSKTPVILVTSRDRQEDQQRGLHLGAAAYVIKRKFDHEELLGTIRQLL